MRFYNNRLPAINLCRLALGGQTVKSCVYLRPNLSSMIVNTSRRKSSQVDASWWPNETQVQNLRRLASPFGQDLSKHKLEYREWQFTWLNFKFPGTCDRIVLYLRLRWYCREVSLTLLLKKIWPGLKLENENSMICGDRQRTSSFLRQTKFSIKWFSNPIIPTSLNLYLIELWHITECMDFRF